MLSSETVAGAVLLLTGNDASVVVTLSRWRACSLSQSTRKNQWGKALAGESRKRRRPGHHR